MLTPVPWQPTLYVHVDLLVKLEQVRARMGRPPLLYGARSAWRSYAVQKALWDAYQNGSGNIASNPDTGNRTHMRGVAADLADYSPAMQQALVAVGLQRDPAEAWHWQLPAWRNYPIIPTLVVSTPRTTRRRNDMDAYVIGRIDNGKIAEVSLCHPTLVGPSDLERGYIVIREGKAPNGETITLQSAIVAAARAHGLGYSETGVNGGDRPTYVAGQQLARDSRAQYLRDRAEFATAIAKALGSLSGGASDPKQILDAIATVPAKTVNELKTRL